MSNPSLFEVMYKHMVHQSIRLGGNHWWSQISMLILNHKLVHACQLSFPTRCPAHLAMFWSHCLLRCRIPLPSSRIWQLLCKKQKKTTLNGLNLWQRLHGLQFGMGIPQPVVSFFMMALFNLQCKTSFVDVTSCTG